MGQVSIWSSCVCRKASVSSSIAREMPLKICFVSHSANTGGAERVLLETIEVLSSEGVLCFVVLPSVGPLCGELDARNVPYVIITYPMWMARGKISVLRKFKAALNLTKDTLIVAHHIRRLRSDLVYSNSITVCVGAFASWLVGCRHVWQIHEFGEEDQGLTFLFGPRCSTWLINHLSSLCICVSNAVARKFSQFIHPSKIRVIYPSMHHALFPNSLRRPSRCLDSDGPFRCLLVGALIEGKGQRDAIQAISDLKQRGVRVELLLAGEGDSGYRRVLEGLVDSEGVHKEIRFLGFVSDVASLIQSVDAVLVCSRSEAFGRVTIESMLSGKPLIGAGTAATAELIQDGVTGLLYRPGDHRALADKIVQLQRSPELRRQLAEEAASWALQRFSAGRYRDELLGCIRPLVNHGVECKSDR